ncbi:NB-ARC domain-containing protein [Dactylosporangium sp. CS-047395]|uniref:NB-ARC domain-containing protein n=1 Tax=Dactylosporangium sp. CS-047395 TaxID=3239936 RepID=UPI003D940A8B
MADRVDVLIVVALPEEFAAAQEALAGAGPLSVRLVRATGPGGRELAPLLATLTETLRPAVVAMCGVCAGNPANTALGDVVVAEPVYQWDEGRLAAGGFEGDHRQFRLDTAWVRAAQDFDPSGLPCHGPADAAAARHWLLDRLLLGEDPRTHPARARYFTPGTWPSALAALETEGLIDRAPDGAARLTPAGEALARRRGYDDVDGPQRLPFAVHVAPMASGNAVPADGSIWARLQRLGMGGITAAETGAATVGTVAHQGRVPRWLVVKGVADHGDATADDDRYRAFAARASAQVLVALLHRLVPALRTEAAGGRRPVFSIPPPEPGDIARAGIARDLLARLTSADASLVAMTTALAGAGGFGKTTMARMLVHDPRVRDRFPDGIVWVTVGEDLAGPALADAIDNACAAITGVKPPFTDPTAAGAALGDALGAGRFLLVVDDVWSPEQLRPLLSGGPNTVRLVTTRRRSVLPSGAATVDVDAMTAMEARGLLTAGLGEVPESAQADLLGLTGRWPVLLGLVNGAARVDVRDGAEPSAALLGIRDSLRDGGLTALDPRSPHSRAGAVAATVGVSLDRLQPQERRRFHELAIFPEDVEVPVPVVTRYWAHTAGLTGAGTEALLRTLADLSLLTSSRRDGAHRIRLHDVLRSYLRDAVAGRLPQLHGRFLDAHRDLLPGGEWWQAPSGEAYLWTWLAVHLADAGRQDELRRTVLHPRWLTAKLDHPGAAAVAADLVLCRSNTAAHLEGVIRQNAHLLGRLDPPGAAAATLASRIRPGHPASAIAGDLVAAFDTPQLVATAPPPDLPQPALIRVLTSDGRRPGPLAVTPDGALLISGSGDGRVDLWDGDTGAAVRTWRHGGTVIALEVAADGSWVAAAGRGVRVWDLAMKVERHVLAGPATGTDVTCLASTPDGGLLIGGDTDGDVWVWDTASGDLRFRLAGHRAAVMVLAVSPDGRHLASAGGSPLPERDTAVRLWDLRTGDLERVLPEHPGPVRALRFAPDGTWLAAAGMSDVIRLWDARSGDLRGEISSGAKTVDALIGGAGWLAASGGSLMDDASGFVAVWDFGATGPRQRWRRDGLAEQHALALAPGGELLLSGGGTLLGQGADNFVRVWYAESGELYATLVGHGNGVSGIVTPGHRRWTATTSNDGTVRVWRYESAGAPTADSAVALLAGDPGGRWLATAGAPAVDSAVALLAGDPGGRWLATAGEERLHVRDTRTGAVERVLDGGDRRIETMAVAPDGSWLATGGQDRLVRIWDTASWEPVRELGRHAFWVTSLAPGPHGALLACDGAVRRWDVPSGAEVGEPEFAGLEEPLKVVAVAHDGSWFAAGGGEAGTRAENPVVIGVRATGARHVLPAHRRDIAALAVAPDGSWLASTGDDRVLVWEPLDGRLRHELGAGGAPQRLLAAGPDGRWLAAAGQDGRVRVWDPGTGDLRHVLPGHTGAVRALAAVDARRLATAGDDRSIRVWDVTTGAAVGAIRVDGGLTALAAHGRLIRAGGARGCYCLRITG